MKHMMGFLLTAVLCAGSLCAAEGQAKLYRVDEGVFELRVGKSMDLTNRQVLLSIPVQQDDRMFAQGRFAIGLSGLRLTVVVGQRLDLKRYPNTKKALSDKDECFLDVLDFVAPKGAPGTATFRLSCL